MGESHKILPSLNFQKLRRKAPINSDASTARTSASTARTISQKLAPYIQIFENGSETAKPATSYERPSNQIHLYKGSQTSRVQDIVKRFDWVGQSPSSSVGQTPSYSIDQPSSYLIDQTSSYSIDQTPIYRAKSDNSSTNVTWTQIIKKIGENVVGTTWRKLELKSDFLKHVSTPNSARCKIDPIKEEEIDPINDDSRPKDESPKSLNSTPSTLPDYYSAHLAKSPYEQHPNADEQGAENFISDPLEGTTYLGDTGIEHDSRREESDSNPVLKPDYTGQFIAESMEPQFQSAVASRSSTGHQLGAVSMLPHCSLQEQPDGKLIRSGPSEAIQCPWSNSKDLFERKHGRHTDSNMGGVNRSQDDNGFKYHISMIQDPYETTSESKTGDAFINKRFQPYNSGPNGKRASHLVAFRVDDIDVIRRVDTFQKTLIGQAHYLDECKANLQKLHLSLLNVSLKSSDIDLAKRAMTAGILKFRESHRTMIDQFDSGKVCVDFRCVGAFGEAVIMKSTIELQASDCCFVSRFGCVNSATVAPSLPQRVLLSCLHIELAKAFAEAGISIVGPGSDWNLQAPDSSRSSASPSSSDGMSPALKCRKRAKYSQTPPLASMKSSESDRILLRRYDLTNSQPSIYIPQVTLFKLRNSPKRDKSSECEPQKMKLLPQIYHTTVQNVLKHGLETPQFSQSPSPGLGRNDELQEIVTCSSLSKPPFGRQQCEVLELVELSLIDDDGYYKRLFRVNLN